MRMVVAVPVSAAAFVIMVMVMAVIVAMFMPVGMIVGMAVCVPMIMQRIHALCQCLVLGKAGVMADRKSTRLNSSHLVISYAVFCLKKKKTQQKPSHPTLTIHARSHAHVS